MALTRTVVGIYSKLNAGTAAFATEEFTPPANSLLLVRVYAMRKEGSSSMGTPLISGAGLTYTHRSGATTILAPSWSTTAAWFTAPVGGSPAKMAITVDEASNLNVFEYVVSVIAYTGYDTTTPIGGTLTSGGTNIGDGAESRELSEAPATEDETLVCIDGDSTKAPLKPSWAAGWTLVHEKTASNESGFAIASRGGSTSKTVAVTDSYVGGGSFSKAGMGAIVVRAATSEDVTIAAPAAQATASSSDPTLTATAAAVSAEGTASAPAAIVAVVVMPPTSVATASAPEPSPVVGLGGTPAEASTASSTPTVVAAIAAPAGPAVASGDAPTPSSVMVPPAPTISLEATAPVPAVLIIGTAGAATATAVPPVVLVGKAELDLDVPTRLILDGPASGLRVGQATTALRISATRVGVRVGDEAAAVALDDASAVLSLEPPDSTVVLDDQGKELILDG